MKFLVQRACFRERVSSWHTHPFLCQGWGQVGPGLIATEQVV